MTDVKEKLTGGTFKHVEGELYHYHITKKELEELTDMIIHRTGDTQPNPQQIKDPTGEKATSILMDRRITHMKKIVEAIETVYESLSEDKKQLVHLLYWKRPKELTWDGIANELHVSKRQAQRWRKSIVESIAKKLGWR